MTDLQLTESQQAAISALGEDPGDLSTLAD